MKRLILILLSLLFAVVVFENCGTARNARVEEISYFEENILKFYGEEIYKRESCYNCHTQQIEKENLQLISLDGLGGKYSSIWLYHYLLEPDALIPQSSMPPFSNLHISPLDKEFFLKVCKEKGLKKSNDKLWDDLCHQAEILSEELNSRGRNTTPKNTEVLALISYLQDIPSSKKKIELDSLEYVKQLNKEKIWDNITWDSTSIILEIANNKENINKGKLLFKSNCSLCHGQQGEGGIGPNLTDEYWLHGGNKLDMARTIVYGIPEKGMIPWKSQLTPTEVGELTSYLTSLKDTNPEKAKFPQGKKQ